MQSPQPRVATLVLVRPDGQLVGELAPFRVDTPWWQDAEPLVRGAREHHGVDVTILRLLEAALPSATGGAVTYLAEVHDHHDVAGSDPDRWAGALVDHPLRLPYARPGGPDRDLAWAGAVLAEQGLRRVGPAEQVRTWNLSSLWRLPVEGQTVWLKVVPPFFAHEGRILRQLGGGPVPRLLGHDAGRILMPELPGEDLYDATQEQMLEMVTLLVTLQHGWASRIDYLLQTGLPDWRPPALAEAIASVVERTAPQLSDADRQILADFVAGLERRFGEIDACGLPQTLVHGDFAPGNVRGRDRDLVLLDWGDCGVGHPLLDDSAFTDRIPPATIPAVRDHWERAWRRLVPGADVRRAAELVSPVAAARQAVIYRRFLDQIEPSEHPYHQADPAYWLSRTAALVRD
jgi:hypothetical protein